VFLLLASAVIRVDVNLLRIAEKSSVLICGAVARAEVAAIGGGGRAALFG
jgi:hypothetical protein